MNGQSDIVFEIKPQKVFSLGVRELVEYRELFYFLSWRDIKVKYKETVLGFFLGNTSASNFYIDLQHVPWKVFQTGISRDVLSRLCLLWLDGLAPLFVRAYQCR